MKPAELWAELAWAVRNALEDVDRDDPIREWNDSMAGACAIASAALARLLRANGYRADFVVGAYRRWRPKPWRGVLGPDGMMEVEDSHAWCLLWFSDRTCIIDVTATQFGMSQGVYIPIDDADVDRYIEEYRGRKAVTHVKRQWRVDEYSNDGLPEAVVKRIQRSAERLLQEHREAA